MARTVLAAFADRVDATPALAALLPGGVTVGWASDGTATPYASLVPTSGENIWNTGDFYPRRTTARLTVFAASVDALEAVGDAVVLAFNPHATPLSFDNGAGVIAVAGPMVYGGEDEGPDGTVLHRGDQSIEFLTSHRI